MSAPDLELATLGGGCFWCMEAVFRDLIGVERVISGFAGGHVEAPSYERVCTGSTGHAEVVQIAFDPRRIPYRDLLEVFFAFHDPTTVDRQGGDVGPQYRSVVFVHSPEQERVAREIIATLEAARVFDAPIVTQVEPYRAFHPAGAHHQDYFARNGNQPYCRAVIAPKVRHLRERYRARLKDATEPRT